MLSFFKIRIVVIILSLMAIIIVGMLKNSLAGWPGECTFILEGAPGQLRDLGYTGVYEYIFDNNTGKYVYTGKSVMCHPEQCWWNQRVSSYYWENGKWNMAGFFTNSYSPEKWPFDGTELPDGCPNRAYNLGPSCDPSKQCCQ